MNPVTLPRVWAHEAQAVPERAALRGGTGDADGPSSTAGWSLQRRCSLSPGQFVGCFVALAALSALVALFFWVQGARFVSYFAGVEMLVLALAFAFHAAHASDGEQLQVLGRSLVIDHRGGLRQGREMLDLTELRVGEAADGTIELRVRGRCLRVGRHADAARRRQVLADLRRLVMQPVMGLPERT